MNQLQSNEVNKIISVKKASNLIKDNMTLMIGGFGGVGNPPTMIRELLRRETENLTIICNDAGFPNIGVGKLVTARRVKKLIASHIGSNPIAGKQMTEGELIVEFSPQGTLAERIRAGGVGLGGVLVDIGLDNEFVAKDKQRLRIDGIEFLVETALTADVSLVYAKKADSLGNLIYDTSARNTNPLVAMAGNITIAEVEEIVPAGILHPEEIITPGAFVDYVVRSEGVDWKWAWEEK